MATTQFKLPIGAKRQVTIPAACMRLLSLEEGGELLLEVAGDHAVLHPMVSVPRHELPEELRQKYLARRGVKASDIPLAQFLDQIGFKSPQAAPPRKKTATAKRKRTSSAEASSRGARAEVR
jgi:bifunctional DNA-binding transcriptional regulator/antitoxin component of YhaV-PrlF toxin-antitoxin module